MARVNREQMESTLEALRGAGVLRAWYRRPMGIYWLVLSDGEKITPDTKETAMWIMGASAAMLAQEDSGTDTLPGLDADAADLVCESLDDMRRRGLLESWRVDADGDFELHVRGQRFFMRPSEAHAFTFGALVSGQAQQEPDMDPDQVGQVLDGLRTIGALDFWRIDETGSYEIFLPGDEHFSIGAWRIGAFVSGAVAVYQAGTASEDSGG